MGISSSSEVLYQIMGHWSHPGRVDFHTDQQLTLAKLGRRLFVKRLADRLFQRMMQVPSHEAFELSESEAKDMNLLGQDPAFAEWDRARESERYRREFLEWNDRLLKNGNERECAKILEQARAK